MCCVWQGVWLCSTRPTSERKNAAWTIDVRPTPYILALCLVVRVEPLPVASPRNQGEIEDLAGWQVSHDGDSVMRQTIERQWYVIDLDTREVLWGPTTCGGAAVFQRNNGGEVVATMPNAIPPHPDDVRDGKAIPPPRRSKARRKPAKASQR